MALKEFELVGVEGEVAETILGRNFVRISICFQVTHGMLAREMERSDRVSLSRDASVHWNVIPANYVEVKFSY